MSLNYLYKKLTYNNQEAQKWWLSKSLINFQKKLNDYNINLQIIKTDSFKLFFDKLVKKKDISIYWNKVYEPDYLKFDEYLIKDLRIKNIPFKIFKGNTLNEIDEVKKEVDELQARVTVLSKLFKDEEEKSFKTKVKEKTAEVREKMKKGKKLSTEDILAFQATKD